MRRQAKPRIQSIQARREEGAEGTDESVTCSQAEGQGQRRRPGTPVSPSAIWGARGREVALRMEQMRSIFGQLLLKDKLKMPAPITVIAFKSDQQYVMVAPAKQSMAGGFYVPGADRVYIILNLFEADPWRAVAHPLAHYLLNYNYPPAQGWFDEGLAEYFGSIQIGKQVEIGGDPELAPEWHEDVFEEIRRDPNRPQSLTQLLSSPVWLSMVDPFSMKHDSSGTHEGIHKTLYDAQPWMAVP